MRVRTQSNRRPLVIALTILASIMLIGGVAKADNTQTTNINGCVIDYQATTRYNYETGTDEAWYQIVAVWGWQTYTYQLGGTWSLVDHDNNTETPRIYIFNHPTVNSGSSENGVYVENDKVILNLGGDMPDPSNGSTCGYAYYSDLEQALNDHLNSAGAVTTD